MDFDPEERKLMDQLRQKYEKTGLTDKEEPEVIEAIGEPAVRKPKGYYRTLSSPAGSQQDAESSRHVTSNTKVQVCGKCQGSGVETEVYNHRRLESRCGGCEGDGTIITENGRRRTDSGAQQENRPQQHNGSSSASSSPAGEGGAKIGRSPSKKKPGAFAERCQRDINAMTAKLAEYQKELDDIRAQERVADEKFQALKKQLESALVPEIAKLDGLIAHRQARMETLLSDTYRVTA